MFIINCNVSNIHRYRWLLLFIFIYISNQTIHKSVNEEWKCCLWWFRSTTLSNFSLIVENNWKRVWMICIVIVMCEIIRTQHNANTIAIVMKILKNDYTQSITSFEIFLISIKCCCVVLCCVYNSIEKGVSHCVRIVLRMTIFCEKTMTQNQSIMKIIWYYFVIFDSLWNEFERMQIITSAALIA
jgi:hypothetical protein